jgi:hypothetical protein
MLLLKVATRLKEVPVRRIAVILLLMMAVTACVKVQLIKHDPNKAVEDASATLGVLFFENDVDVAYPMFDEGFRNATTKEQMSSMLGQITAAVGPMTELQAEGYQPVNGQKAMTLFYQGTFERGGSYLRVVVSGDSGGYKITSLNTSGSPFPEASGSGVHKFDPPIVFTRS